MAETDTPPKDPRQKWVDLPWDAIARMAKATFRTERQVIEMLVTENIPAKYLYAAEAEAELAKEAE